MHNKLHEASLKFKNLFLHLKILRISLRRKAKEIIKLKPNILSMLNSLKTLTLNFRIYLPLLHGRLPVCLIFPSFYNTIFIH